MQKGSKSEGPWKGCVGRDWSSRIGLGWGVSTEVGGPGTCSVCLLRHTQILLEAEGLKKISQAPFLSDGPYHVPWLDETWFYFLKFLRNSNKKRSVRIQGCRSKWLSGLSLSLKSHSCLLLPYNHQMPIPWASVW